MKPPTRCTIAGCVVLAVTAALLPWNPEHSCGGASAPPILGFELATSAADLRAIFGPEGSCRAEMLSSFRIENWIDFAYMISYGAFLSAGVAAFRARRATRLLTLAALAALLAPVADAVENTCLLSLDVDAPGRWLVPLVAASRTKFLLLGAVSVVLAIESWRQEEGWRRCLALAHAPAAPVLLVSVVTGAALPLIMPSVAASWLALLVWAAAARRSASAALQES